MSWATCIFTKIKLQMIASLLYKIGAYFGQYFGYLSPKVSKDQKKIWGTNTRNTDGNQRRKSVLISISILGVSPQK